MQDVPISVRRDYRNQRRHQQINWRSRLVVERKDIIADVKQVLSFKCSSCGASIVSQYRGINQRPLSLVPSQPIGINEQSSQRRCS
jgi:ribosomal protein L44E